MPLGLGSERINIEDHVEVRMRGSSLTRSRRGSSVAPSRAGSLAPASAAPGGVLGSPASFGNVGEIAGADYEFDGM